MSADLDPTYLSPPDRDQGPTLLVVDDEQGQHDCIELICSRHFKSGELRILHAKSIDAALDVLAGTPIHILLLDKDVGPSKNDPGQNGIEAIPKILQIQPHVQIVMVTGSNDHQDIVRAVTLGALNYVTKDTQNQLLPAQIKQAVRLADLSLGKVRAECGMLAFSEDDATLGGRSKVFQRIVSKLPGIAESSRPAVLLGESGVGKTAIARKIHELRQKYMGQTQRPFFGINIAAVSESTAESRLFGHEKGAFTGANEIQQGLFELANSGTLFLDEIGDASYDMQTKLLKVIEEGKFYRMGGKKELRSSFKLICATNRNLEEMVEKGKFREDLYMRISTFVLHIPSLKERTEDIPDIIAALLPRVCRDTPYKCTLADIPKDLIVHLTQHLPRGNIRGIENFLIQLLTWADRDKRGQPILKNWRHIEELHTTSSSSGAARQGALTLKEFLDLPLNVVGDGFPGLTAFMDLVSDKVVLDAFEKHKKNGKVARALKIADGAASVRLHRMRTLGLRVPRPASAMTASEKTGESKSIEEHA